MQTRKKKKNTIKKRAPSSEFLVLDSEIIPVVGITRNGSEVAYPREYELINSLKINQSGVFPTEKLKIINAIRLRIFKLHNKKFVVKKITPDRSRIWRVADSAPTAFGKKLTKKREVWGRLSTASPKKTHKDGTPIVPE